MTYPKHQLQIGLQSIEHLLCRTRLLLPATRIVGGAAGCITSEIRTKNYRDWFLLHCSVTFVLGFGGGRGRWLGMVWEGRCCEWCGSGMGVGRGRWGRG